LLDFVGGRFVSAQKPIVKAPKGLGPKAVYIFYRFAQVLGDRIQPEDASMLAQLAIAELMAIENAKLLLDASNGPIQTRLLETDEAHDNESRKSPAFTQWRQSVETALKLAKEFGMTPASRARLQMGPDPEIIDLKTLLNGDD
jgi:phage terminase small subunit